MCMAEAFVYETTESMPCKGNERRFDLQHVNIANLPLSLTNRKPNAILKRLWFSQGFRKVFAS